MGYWDLYRDEEKWEEYMDANEARKTYRNLTTSYEEDLSNAINGTGEFWGGVAFLVVLLLIAIIAVLVLA